MTTTGPWGGAGLVPVMIALPHRAGDLEDALDGVVGGIGGGSRRGALRGRGGRGQRGAGFWRDPQRGGVGRGGHGARAGQRDRGAAGEREAENRGGEMLTGGHPPCVGTPGWFG